MKPNLSEIGKIVREMQGNYTDSPGYNAAAAAIVQQGVIDKNNARNGYVTKLTPPLQKYTPPENPKVL